MDRAGQVMPVVEERTVFCYQGLVSSELIGHASNVLSEWPRTFDVADVDLSMAFDLLIIFLEELSERSGLFRCQNNLIGHQLPQIFVWTRVAMPSLCRIPSNRLNFVMIQQDVE